MIEFRDAFLQAEPSLLNHVVTKAADMQAANGNVSTEDETRERLD